MAAISMCSFYLCHQCLIGFQAMCGTQRSSGHSSNKSTLSSSTCGSPDGDDFARQLIERSLPRRHSMVFTASPLAAVEIDAIVSVAAPSSKCSIERQRSRILTNPKCRSGSCVISEDTADIQVIMRESKI